MTAVLPGWTHDVSEALESGLTEAVAGVDWNSSGAISRILDDASCGIAVASHRGRIVAYVKAVEVFNKPVTVDSAEAVKAAVAEIAAAIGSRL